MFLIHGAEFYQIAKKQPNTADLEFFPELDPRYEEAWLSLLLMLSADFGW